MVETGQIALRGDQVQSRRDLTGSVELATDRAKSASGTIPPYGRAIGASNREGHPRMVQLVVGKCDQRHGAGSDTSAVSSQPLELSRAAERNDHALRR